MKILIADDYSLMRKKLMEIVREAFPAANITEVASGYDALKQMQENQWTLIMLDASMPGLNGIETLRRAKKISIETPVLMMSINTEHYYATKALKTGASGYLTKESSVDELVLAIKTITKGKRYVSRSLEGQCHISQPTENTIEIKPFQSN
jgi:two-component system, NarL family, invasion response regulator UvrY